MLATLLSLACLAPVRSLAIPLPQLTVPPLLFDTWTGTSSPITPASRRTTPTAIINRRTVMIRPFSKRTISLVSKGRVVLRLPPVGGAECGPHVGGRGLRRAQATRSTAEGG